MKDLVYDIYRTTKRLIQRVEKCPDKDHSDEGILKEWHEIIDSLDKTGRSFSERYEREEAIVASFTSDQINHICYQIGDWYLLMKPLLEDQHNLGHMKEVLKIMICGEE